MKKYLVSIFLLMMVVLTGCTQQTGALQTTGSRMENLSSAEAKEKALADSGVSVADVKNISTELKKKDGREYYEVDFSTDNEEVSYDVDALTGAILGSKHEKKGSGQTPPAQDSAQAPAQSQDQSQTQTQATQMQNQSPAQTQTPAQSQIRDLTEQAPANSGSAPKKETINSQPAKEPQLVPADDGILSEARVKELVLQRIPGASAANFVEFHKDYDDGRMEYEGKVIYQNTEYEFEIDAYSGAFRDWDVEFFGR